MTYSISRKVQERTWDRYKSRGWTIILARLRIRREFDRDGVGKEKAPGAKERAFKGIWLLAIKEGCIAQFRFQTISSQSLNAKAWHATSQE